MSVSSETAAASIDGLSVLMADSAVSALDLDVVNATSMAANGTQGDLVAVVATSVVLGVMTLVTIVGKRTSSGERKISAFLFLFSTFSGHREWLGFFSLH